MKTIIKIKSYVMNHNPDGTRNGEVFIRTCMDFDGSLADSVVVQANDGTEETVTGKLVTHLAKQAARETGETLTDTDIKF